MSTQGEMNEFREFFDAPHRKWERIMTHQDFKITRDRQDFPTALSDRHAGQNLYPKFSHDQVLFRSAFLAAH